VRVFETIWAARFRLAGLTSEAYRRSQILEAMARIDRLKHDVGKITVAGTAIPVEQLITSKKGVALMLDSHINAPNAVGTVLDAAAAATPVLPTDPDQRDRELTTRFEKDARGGDEGQAQQGHQRSPVRRRARHLQGLVKAIATDVADGWLLKM
jgi:hypothetical protein